jgi:hypothetical protein
MSKRKCAILIVGILVVVLVGISVSLYFASQYVPPFYRDAVNVDSAKQKAAGLHMLEQVTALAAAFKKDGEWDASFTSEEVNAWLADDLHKEHPNSMPKTLDNPRISIKGNRVTVACLFEVDHFWSVVSLNVEPYMSKPDVLALRFVNARAGLVPMPLEKVLAQLPQIASRLKLHLEWRQVDGAPVALLSIPPEPEGKRQVHLDALQLGKDEISISGHSTKNHKNTAKDTAAKDQKAK